MEVLKHDDAILPFVFWLELGSREGRVYHPTILAQVGVRVMMLSSLSIYVPNFDILLGTLLMP